jgi:transcriptional regulator with XRE-family HTH domain
VDSTDDEKLPVEQVTIDQIVAINMRYFRRKLGLTQEELGERLGWSAANVSSFERSVSEARDRRRFDAQTLTEIAEALGIPLIALFLPPEDDGYKRHYTFRLGVGEEPMGMADLERIIMHDREHSTPAVEAYRTRLRTTMSFYLGERWRREGDRWLGPRGDKQARIDRAAELESKYLAGLEALAELADEAEAIRESLEEDEP